MGGAIGRLDQEQVPSYTMREKTPDRSDPAYRQSWSPRPGAAEYDVTHEHVDLIKQRSPKFSMRSRTPTGRRSQSPAPGRYENPQTVGTAHPTANKAPSWQFGYASRDNAVGRIMQFVPATPSPTKYEVPRGGAIGRVDQERV